MTPIEQMSDEQLDIEIIRLRKQKELFYLRRSLCSSNPSNMAEPICSISSIRIDIGAIESMVAVFNGDDCYDVNKWFDDLEDAFIILQFDDREKFVGCRRLTAGTAAAFLRTVTVHHYGELKTALIEEFGRTYTLQEVFKLLKARRLKPDESLKRYVIEMQEIAYHDINIDGIDDKSHNIAILYSAQSVQQLKLLLDRYERKRVKLVFIPPIRVNKAGANFQRQPVVNIPKTTGQSVIPSSVTIGSTAAITCYNCSGYGHFQAQCTLPKRPISSWFRCSSTSHVHKACPLRASANAAAVYLSEGEDAVIEKINALQMVSVDFNSEDKCK